MKLKASKPVLNANSNASYDFRRFIAFYADSVHLKKPSRWPGGPKSVPHAMGPPGRRRH
jgi:hypothetical protein